MEKNYMYALVYVVDGKAVVKATSCNYTLIQHKKKLYDELMQSKGAIKKVAKRA